MTFSEITFPKIFQSQKKASRFFRSTDSKNSYQQLIQFFKKVFYYLILSKTRLILNEAFHAAHDNCSKSCENTLFGFSYMLDFSHFYHFKTKIVIFFYLRRIFICEILNEKLFKISRLICLLVQCVIYSLNMCYQIIPYYIVYHK